MKIIHIISLAIIAVSLLSCKKFLDVEPKDYAADEFTITDKKSAESALNGTYRNLAAETYYGRTFQFIIYLQGGDLGWGDSRTVNREFIQNNVRADNEEVNNVWKAIYKTINSANHVIAKVPGVSDPQLTTAQRDAIVGEAYFIRALCYFDLARTWGGVQLVLTPTSKVDDKKGISRSTLAQTYAQVLSDLNVAENLLPETTNRIRATKKTVWALKARLYLYQQEWTLAEFNATKLISDVANYPLVAPFNSWWTNNAIGSRESIFETSYSAVQRNPHRNSWQPSVDNKGGIRSWFPDDEFVALINDPVIGGNRNKLVVKASNGQWYGDLYYRSAQTDPSYILRIAEQYLIRAEARAQLEDLSGALSDLDAVRTRAGLTGSTATTKDEILLAIENERRFEFAYEPHRWFDLVRTGRADEAINLTDPNKYVLPIPIGQMIVDPLLTPNQGY
jgi:hypothetical protein